MVIESLRLWNFRNYKDLKINFEPQATLFYGLNGQGKTNLIEALYLLTHLRSFRSSSLEPLLYFGEKEAVIEGIIKKRQTTHEIKIQILRGNKRVWVDGKLLSLSSEFLQNFFSLLFAPDQLTAYKENPQEKRSFFDRALCLLDLFYVENLKEFNRARKQKNILLKQGRDQEITVWNQLISKSAPKLIAQRRLLINEINESIGDVFSKLTHRTDKLEIHYRSDLEEKTDLSPEQIFEFYQSRLSQEKELGFSLPGPQKDSFWMTLNQKKDKMTFSQGEQRVAFLSLQFVLRKVLKEKLDFTPILLLDDVFSELDPEVRKHSLEEIFSKNSQVFLTAASCDADWFDSNQAIKVEQGCITK